MYFDEDSKLRRNEAKSINEDYRRKIEEKNKEND